MTQHHGELRETYPTIQESFEFHLEERDGRVTFQVMGEADTEPDPFVEFAIEPRVGNQGLCRTEDGRTHRFAWAWVGRDLHLWLDGALHIFQRVESRRRGRQSAASDASDILAPMPGAILEVLVAEGDRVEQNQTVILMESMKMELVITASRDGIIRRVAVEAGQQVDRGMRLLELAPDADDQPST